MTVPRTEHLGDDLSRCIDALCRAHTRTTGAAGDMPSLSDSRELVRLFIQIEAEEVRHALLHLMRTIAGPPR